MVSTQAAFGGVAVWEGCGGVVVVSTQAAFGGVAVWEECGGVVLVSTQAAFGGVAVWEGFGGAGGVKSGLENVELELESSDEFVWID